VIAAIVLAAGTSTRMGRQKLMLPMADGRPLVRVAVEQVLGAGVDDTVVVLGGDAEAVSLALAPLPVRTVVNPHYAEGQSTSLAAGIAACAPGSEAAVVLLGDQPGIREDHVRALATVFEDTGAEILRLRFRDGPGPTLLARAVWSELEAIAGDVGARALSDADPGRVRWIAVDEDAPADVDAPEDLERA